MFIDPDPALPDQVAFANGHDPETGEWDFVTGSSSARATSS
jgi:hypothetical protein